MAMDWIKMRSVLFTHPKFLSLSRALIYGEDIGLLVYTCGADALEIGVPSEQSINERALRIVTESALRDVTMCALLRVWCAVNAHCKIDGTDAVMDQMDDRDVDVIAGFDGFGEALFDSGWCLKGQHNSLIFPNFLEFNEPACLRQAPKSNAERQREFRQRRQRITKSNESNDRAEQRRSSSASSAEADAASNPAGVPDSASAPQKGSVFDGITAENLRDTIWLSDWFRKQSKSKRPLVKNPKIDDFVHIVAAAERALAAGKNPVALFARIVGSAAGCGVAEKYHKLALLRVNEFNEMASKSCATNGTETPTT